MTKSFNLIPNKSKKWALKLSKEIEKYLIENNFKKSLNPDVTIIIGGDGSFYYNLNKVKGKVLIIGSESTYRSHLNRNNWKENILELIKRKKTVKLPLISVYKNNKLIGEGVNDIVFHSKDFKISNFSIQVNKDYMFYRGDGLIISTPFGSTAYSYSAGGPKLSLDSKQLVLTPICPYLRKVKPTKIEGKKEIKVLCDDNAILMIDGIIKRKKCFGDYIITKSKKTISYII